jgi:hypothetical protein
VALPIARLRVFNISLRVAQHKAASHAEMDEGRRPSPPTDAAMGSLDPSKKG